MDDELTISLDVEKKMKIKELEWVVRANEHSFIFFNDLIYLGDDIVKLSHRFIKPLDGEKRTMRSRHNCQIAQLKLL